MMHICYNEDGVLLISVYLEMLVVDNHFFFFFVEASFMRSKSLYHLSKLCFISVLMNFRRL